MLPSLCDIFVAMTEHNRLVRRLREEPGLSRNRHFDEMSKPEARRAQRVARWLAGLERDIEAGASVELRPHADGWLVRIVFPAVRAMRETWLSVEEYELLRESGVLARRLLSHARAD